MFAEQSISTDGRIQRRHYDRVAAQYLESRTYPHTQEYEAYLGRELRATTGSGSLGVVAEICCGAGEAFSLCGDQFVRGVGVDVSLAMLEAARARVTNQESVFVQGDATMLPLADNAFDTVFMLGGIHHVNDRLGLFREVARVLKPGGTFYWREPVSDLFLWRWLRAVVYRMSASLDEGTERPLRHDDTIPVLREAGLRLRSWRTHGFAGYCLLMNSDVLVVTRGLRHLPAIRALTRAAARLDEVTLRLPGLQGAGLIVIGAAVKPSVQQGVHDALTLNEPAG